MNMHKIHWLGAGLSSGPGIRAIAQSGRTFVLWNRTMEKARAALEGIAAGPEVSARAFSLEAFQAALGAGDIVVSMLPATMHPEIAELCLSNKAHLVTTSYISDAMRALHARAAAQGLCFVNESGLDPGLDHLLAHRLVAEYRASNAFTPDASLSFRSYCGGFPQEAGPFRYKFSWSPLGVLRALTNPARFISGGRETTVTKAWEAVTDLALLGETFEVYPNRDSVPYLSEYGFESDWKIDVFVRGTIRLSGWKQAWSSIFARIASSSAAELETLSQDLWNQYAYLDGEEDRVVLYVALDARVGHQVTWSRFYALDESGSGRDTAMARLVSLPATYAIERIERGSAPPGVSGAPHTSPEIDRWLGELKKQGVRLKQGESGVRETNRTAAAC